MWLITPNGFWSVVVDPDDSEMLVVRSRTRSDLRPVERALSDAEVEYTPWRDYHYRTRVSRTEWMTFVLDEVAGMDYTNVKDAVKDRQGKRRAAVYGRVWAALLGLQKRRPWSGMPPRERERVG